MLTPVGSAVAQDMPMGGMQMGNPAGAPLGISMERMGSGTTWIPDAVTVPARHFMAGSWELMLHGFVFGQYIKQSGPRGDDQFGSLNWGMFMASRELGGGRFQVRSMLSLDAATVTRRGYPLLFQTGEVLDGERQYDVQHPHDFWMEVAVQYERPLTTNLGVALYAAPSGEPALGPVAFMHRPSAMDNPFAPLGHHWQDATHIAFGVVTAGVFGRSWKLEGSVFNGREPNDERWDFDRIRLNSYSGRLTVNPAPAWSLSAGYGTLADHELLTPNVSIHRFTASALHGTKLGTEGQWSSALIYGVNNSDHHGRSWSAALESEAILDRRNTLFTRVEHAQRSAEDLGIVDHGTHAVDKPFTITSASLGYIQELGRGWGATMGVGVMGTLNVVPSALEEAYGSRMPLGGVVFIRIRPFHVARGMEGMHHNHQTGKP